MHEDKIDVAKQGWLRKSLTQPFANRISFLHADALACELPESDLFILNDMLHYLGRDDQRQTLAALRLAPTYGRKDTRTRRKYRPQRQTPVDETDRILLHAHLAVQPDEYFALLHLGRRRCAPSPASAA